MQKSRSWLTSIQKRTTNQYWSKIAANLGKVISPQGMVIARTSAEAAGCLKEANFKVFNLVGGVMLAIAPRKPTLLQGKQVVFVSGLPILGEAEASNIGQVERSTSPSALSKELQLHFSAIVGRNSVKAYSLQDLGSVDFPPKTITISLLELEKPFLATMDPEEMNLLRRVTDKTTDLIWLTGATYMSGSSPDLTLASGLSRALMLEQPSLRFVILDIGNPPQIPQSNRSRICGDVERSLFADDIMDDKEFVSRNGLLHVSRFVPDDGLNSRFSQRKNQQPTEMTLEAASPARLAIKTVGNMDTIFFQQESDGESEIPKGEIDIDVKAVSLNAKVYNNAKVSWSQNY